MEGTKKRIIAREELKAYTKDIADKFRGPITRELHDKYIDELIAAAIKVVEETTGMNAEQWCLECDLDEQEYMNDVFIEYFGEGIYGAAWNGMFHHYGI